MRHYRLRLQHWLARLYPGMASLAEMIFTQHTDPVAAEARLLAALSPDPTALAGLSSELATLYTDAYAGGRSHAARRGPTLGLWEPWRPVGQLIEAQDVNGPGLDALVGGATALASDLAATQRTRAGEILAGVISGETSREQLRFSIRHLQAAHAQAEVTATTEAARGQLAAAVDALRAAGVPMFDVLNDTDPCPLCVTIASRNPHPIGQQTPPFHPRCRCSITPA